LFGPQKKIERERERKRENFCRDNGREDEKKAGVGGCTTLMHFHPRWG
jgi:hypothetical protein